VFFIKGGFSILHCQFGFDFAATIHAKGFLIRPFQGMEVLAAITQIGFTIQK